MRNPSPPSRLASHNLSKARFQRKKWPSRRRQYHRYHNEKRLQQLFVQELTEQLLPRLIRSLVESKVWISPPPLPHTRTDTTPNQQDTDQ